MNSPPAPAQEGDSGGKTMGQSTRMGGILADEASGGKSPRRQALVAWTKAGRGAGAPVAGDAGGSCSQLGANQGGRGRGQGGSSVGGKRQLRRPIVFPSPAQARQTLP